MCFYSNFATAWNTHFLDFRALMIIVYSIYVSNQNERPHCTGRRCCDATSLHLPVLNSNHSAAQYGAIRHVAAVQDQRLSAPSGCSARSTYQLLGWLVQCFVYMHFYSDKVTNYYSFLDYFLHIVAAQVVADVVLREELQLAGAVDSSSSGYWVHAAGAVTDYCSIQVRLLGYYCWSFWQQSWW